MVSELGFDPYSSVLIAHEDLISKQPGLVRKFTQASIQGWKDYLLKDSTKVHAHIQAINPEMPLEVLDQGLESLKKLCLNEQGQFTGEMSDNRWQELVEQLELIKLLEPNAIQSQELYTREFLNE